MIRLECFIDGKNVEAVMFALAGLVREPQWTPVVNTTNSNDNKIVALTKGDNLSMLERYLETRKGNMIRTSEVRRFCESIGAAPAGANSLIRRAQASGLLKKNGRRGSKTGYTVL